MKKLILTLILAAFGATGAYSQTEAELRADSLQKALDEVTIKAEREKLNKKIWGKGRFLRLGYAWAQTGDDFSPVEKSNFSVFLTKGTTYRFPKNPIGGLVKIGIDAVWFDLQATKYKSPYSSVDWTSEVVPPEYDDDDDAPDFDLNIGRWGISFGMGVGPNVSVAPFALTSIKALQPLRASVYFHYAPTMQLYFKSQNDEFEMSTAFCHMMNFGGTLTYRGISVGVEGRWGKGKFKPLDLESLFGEESDAGFLGTEKYTRRFANTRLYIQFAF